MHLMGYFVADDSLAPALVVPLLMSDDPDARRHAAAYLAANEEREVGRAAQAYLDALEELAHFERVQARMERLQRLVRPAVWGSVVAALVSWAVELL